MIFEVAKASDTLPPVLSEPCRIEVGKDANLTVREQSRHDVDPMTIKEIDVWDTMLEGRVQPAPGATVATNAVNGETNPVVQLASDTGLSLAAMAQRAALIASHGGEAHSVE